jgi:hypothetical protein
MFFFLMYSMVPLIYKQKSKLGKWVLKCNCPNYLLYCEGMYFYGGDQSMWRKQPTFHKLVKNYFYYINLYIVHLNTDKNLADNFCGERHK